jgi:3-phenylpropionate/cinnamic acid dioxygenase small subunit
MDRFYLPNAFTGYNVKYSIQSYYTAWNSSGANFQNQESKSFVLYGHKIHDSQHHTANLKILSQKILLWSEMWIIINSQSLALHS